MNKALLRAVEYDDIQLLRYWRNLDHVRNCMVVTTYINRDNQRQWFEGLSLDSSQYYIYSLDMRDIGCTSLTKINPTEKTFEGGIFCGDTIFLNHWINIWASVKTLNYAFFELNLDTAFATILKNNATALTFNQSLGYKFIEDIDDNIGRFVLTRNDYVKSSAKIQRYLRDFAKQTL